MHTIVEKYYNPNRKTEPKRKKDWKRLYADFVITQLPGPSTLLLEHIKPGSMYAFDYVDDNYLVIDRSSSKKEDLYWGGGFLGAFLFIALTMGNPFNGEIIYWILLAAFLLLLPAIWSFILAFFAPKEKKLIFDRMRGLVQLPGAFWDEPHLVHFNDMHPTIGTSRSVIAFIAVARFRNWYDNFAGPLSLPLTSGKALQSWSFFVWYMDKNRPLPPSEALDPFRERDYERRKNEGFPKPLYPSNIETPEHNTAEYRQMLRENLKAEGTAGVTLEKLLKNMAKEE